MGINMDTVIPMRRKLFGNDFSSGKQNTL